MKNLLRGILILSLFLFTTMVKAEENEIFFTNKNGVGFTRFQYETLVDGMGLSPVLNMTASDYDALYIGEMNENDTNITVYEDYDVIEEDSSEGISTRGTVYHETAYKKLSGITSCSSTEDYCIVTGLLEWKQNPSTRSRDVLGFLLHSATFKDDSSTLVAFMNGSTTHVTSQKNTSTGRAAIVKLSSSGNIGSVSMSAKITRSGTSQVSYQHAVSNITLTTAMNFTFSASGLGGVFAYPSGALGYYDAMAGVRVTNS